MDGCSPLRQTYIGSVLVSVNPYKELEIYTKNHMERYRGVNFYEVSPHMWVHTPRSTCFSLFFFGAAEENRASFDQLFPCCWSSESPFAEHAWIPKVARANCAALHSEISPRCRHPVASCSGSLAFLSGQSHCWPDMVAWGRQSVWDVSTAMVSAIIFTLALQTPVAQLQEQSRASQRLTVSSSSIFTITSLEFFCLRSLTLAECSFLSSFSLYSKRWERFTLAVATTGSEGRKPGGGEVGRKVNIWWHRAGGFLPSEGIPLAWSWSSAVSRGVGKKCPNRLKQHNRARHWQAILELQQAAFQLWTGIHTGDQCLSMFALLMMSCAARTALKRARLLPFHT